MRSVIQNLLGTAKPPITLASASHEQINYSGGQITLQYRLLPQHQDALETALAKLETQRVGNVAAATSKYTDAMRLAKESFERTRSDATAERDKAVNAAHAEYEAAHRKLLIQFGKPPTPEELAMARTKPGQVLDLRNVVGPAAGQSLATSPAIG